MDRPLQFSLRALLMQVTLIAVAIVCLQSIGYRAGPLGSACLFELAVAALTAAAGIFLGQPSLAAGLAAVVMLPFACLVYRGN